MMAEVLEVSQRSSSLSRRRRISKTICIAVLLLLFPSRGYAQIGGLFDISPVIELVKYRFKLNKKETATIGPLIREENLDVVSIYARFGGEEPDYSPLLWHRIMIRRHDFEDRIRSKPNNRQKSALRAARTELEDRVLNLVVDDFVFSLGPYLDLSGLEIEAVQNILNAECKRKHRLIVRDIFRPQILERELEIINAETKRKLKRILSPEQFRAYMALMGPEDLIVETL